MEGRDGIIASFEDNLALNPDLKNPVGHISLNLHANDKDKVDGKTMVEIVQKYMKKMGIVDTPYIMSAISTRIIHTVISCSVE